MLRAVPLTERMAASMSKQFRSGILILAISSTCFGGDLADLGLVRFRRTLGQITARLISTGTGGVLVMNVNDRSE